MATVALGNVQVLWVLVLLEMVRRVRFAACGDEGDQIMLVPLLGIMRQSLASEVTLQTRGRCGTV